MLLITFGQHNLNDVKQHRVHFDQSIFAAFEKANQIRRRRSGNYFGQGY